MDISSAYPGSYSGEYMLTAFTFPLLGRSVSPVALQFLNNSLLCLQLHFLIPCFYFVFRLILCYFWTSSESWQLNYEKQMLEGVTQDNSTGTELLAFCKILIYIIHFWTSQDHLLLFKYSSEVFFTASVIKTINVLYLLWLHLHHEAGSEMNQSKHHYRIIGQIFFT